MWLGGWRLVHRAWTASVACPHHSAEPLPIGTLTHDSTYDMLATFLRPFTATHPSSQSLTAPFPIPLYLSIQITVDHSLSFGVENGSQWQMISHGKKVARLHRPADQRKALLRNLTTDLLRYGRITTTMARAKAMRKPVEHMITLGKEGSEHKKRQAEAYIFDKELVEALFQAAPERYKERTGGYTRIVRTLRRRGDNAEMAIIELV